MVASLLAEAGLLPDVVHTSVLRRAITTANLALDAVDRHWIPVRRSWRLNERHYGALQGLDKAATRDKYGDEQFMLWRRSFDTPPPPIDAGSEFDQTGDPRYAGVERAAHRVPQGRHPADDAVLGERHPGRPHRRPHGARHRPRQLAARARQAPRRHQRRRHRRAQHPHRHAAGLPARRRLHADRPAASTSTRRPPPPPPPPSRTRAADRRSGALSPHPRPQVARVAAAHQRLPPAEPSALAGPR